MSLSPDTSSSSSGGSPRSSQTSQDIVPPASPGPSPGPPNPNPPPRHTPPYSRAERPAPPPKRSHISINTAHCPTKTPLPEPRGPPTDGPGTEARARDPRQSKQSREGRKANPSTR
ncbi:hypothetical protein AMECASPLE_039518 [Ameca splendens]|uniref:Uncharacterized protein n=1 Tax=Ameca splendens TaxID=208324 RepID=A0ABV0Y8E9_9TELE